MLQAAQKIILAKQKILMTSFENTKRILTGEEKILLKGSEILLPTSKILIPSFKILMVSFGILSLRFLIINNTYADESSNLDYAITVEPSLNVTTSAQDISLNLNPANHPFDTKDLTVSVGTNNETGYKLILSTIDNTTNLVEQNDSSLYIETLTTESDESNFPGNRWGYKLDSTNTNYIPFTSNVLISSSNKPTPTIITNTLSFAAKANYNTKAGTYNLALNFQALANPLIYYIQDFTKELCSTQAVDSPVTVIDKRDDKEYQVRYINGNCWMVQNLRYVGDAGSASGSMVMKKETSNIDADKTISYADLTSGSNYNNPRIHDSGDISSGAWYNYAAASAMTITGSSNSTTASQDICPKNWRFPTSSEQSDITNYKEAFDPVAGGCFLTNGKIDYTDYGFWWSATSYENNGRYNLYYHETDLSLKARDHDGYRNLGFYIRCVRSN